MSTVRASCPDCGDVEFSAFDPAVDLTVNVWASNNRGEYRFRCPLDGLIVIKDAEPRIVDLLVATGVELHVINDDFMQRELAERSYINMMMAELYKPISHDTLLDFHNKINQADIDIVHHVQTDI